MKRSILIGAVQALLLSQANTYQFDSKARPASPAILPLPKDLTHGDKVLYIDQCNFNFEVNDIKGSDLVAEVANDYLGTIFPKKALKCGEQSNSANVPKISALKIHLTGEVNELLSSLKDTDESYTISILEDATEISLSAPQYSGVVRGLSTLAQLIKSSKDQKNLHEIAHTPITINDSPRYSYRGLMLDTSRRFFKIDTIKEIIDSLAASKFNVFHWHIVDDDSFPLQLDSYPDLHQSAAFSVDNVYTKDDVSDVVAYAAKLAIRVVPEFDNPGHVRAIGLDSSFNDIIRCFNVDWPNSVPNAYKINGGPPTGVMDPSEDRTYELLTGILTDLNALFPDTLVHLGGDEVFTSCFDENPNIKTFMAANKISTYSDLINHHLAKSRDILTNINSDKQALYWSNEDTFYMRYSEQDILMYWGHSASIDELKSTYPNNQFVFSPSDYYYLDCGYGNKYGGNSWCDPFKTWWTIYQFEPSTYLNDGSVIGGEVPAWSELFGDANIHSRIWPRAAAMADKLWGQNVPIDLEAIVNRQTAFSDLLTSRGIPTTPITSTWCEVNSDHCFGKYGTKYDAIVEEKIKESAIVQ